MQPIALSIPEAAKFSGIGRTRLWELVSSGKVRAVKHGTRTLVLTDSLRAYVESLPAVEVRNAA
jgi:excisionase family DNA binding protein